MGGKAEQDLPVPAGDWTLWCWRMGKEKGSATSDVLQVQV